MSLDFACQGSVFKPKPDLAVKTDLFYLSEPYYVSALLENTALAPMPAIAVTRERLVHDGLSRVIESTTYYGPGTKSDISPNLQALKPADIILQALMALYSRESVISLIVTTL